jgi:hypothetical protein
VRNENINLACTKPPSRRFQCCPGPESCVALGQKDKASEWLEKVYEVGCLVSDIAPATVDPVFDPLRSDPRFADLLRRMNLQP